MGDGQAAAGFDRLPWLPDEPSPPKRGVRELQGWTAAAVIVVAGASYWMGANSWREIGSHGSSAPLAAQTTVPLPKPPEVKPAMPQVTPERLAEVEPVIAPPLPAINEPAPPSRRRHPAQVRRRPHHVSAAIPQSKGGGLTPWPVRAIGGASGRLVRIGAFASPAQAKKGWRAIMGINPALQRLPAMVVPAQSLRNGQVYYRLQMGTTSPAHSEVLCQRMRMIGQSCVVIGLSR